MSGERFVLAIDQGTTSTRAILFDRNGQARASAQVPLTQIYPAPGQVEHDPEEIWRSVLDAGRAALRDIEPAAIAGLGITNQRETTVVWERATGRPLANAIVWQDRRTAPLCGELLREGWGDHVAQATGLVIDPYFSATKLAWLLQNVPGLEARARAGEVCFGTIDSFLLYRLTGGRLHATDATNAARTMLYDIRSGAWDEKLLDRLGVPRAMLPEVRDTQSDFGLTGARAFRRRDPDQGRRRRPAGGRLRTGLLRTRHAQGDLRNGVFRACQYRRREGRVRHAHAVDDLPSDRWQADLCAGGRDLHGRRHGAVAQGQSRPDRVGGRERGFGARGRSQCAHLSRSGLPGSGRAVLGCRRARRDLRLEPRRVQGRSRGGGARGRRVPDPRSSHRDAPRHGGERHHARPRRSGSMAA